MVRPLRFWWGFALLGVLLIGLMIWTLAAPLKPARAAGPHSGPQAVAVTTAKASLRDIPLSIDTLGAAQAWQSVLITAQVSGQLTYVAPEGTDVSVGQVVAQIDPATYRAALIQAQGALSRDTALLQAARVNLTRDQTLAAQDSIARQDLDTQAALVKQDEGTVAVDQGAVAAAEVNLSHCRITAPVSGRIGVRLIDPGNVITAGATAGIVSINQITPIAVTFKVPQGDFQRLADVSGGFTRPMTTEALSQETGAVLGDGVLGAADNHVDPATGTVEMKARFANMPKRLWPGQFVNVRLTLQTLSQAVVIPSAAVNQGPRGAYVYVVAATGKAAVQPIAVLATQDGMAVISSGLSSGQTVVTDGQMALKAGMTVSVRQPPGGPPSQGQTPSGRRPAA